MDTIIKLNKAKTSLKGSISRIENFADKVSEDTSLMDLEVKLKKIDQLQQNVISIRRNSFELDDADATELTDLEEELEQCDVRLEDLEAHKQNSNITSDIRRLFSNLLGVMKHKRQCVFLWQPSDPRLRKTSFKFSFNE
ncbi:hypothetical protein HNY73_019113 [Argiope bruennichi]|uniref:Uncharacterized protein n=1 Tax=Argiope bruennichi TaxID=94029 RepID=A0A8T0EGK0_ARGBR|nr:hypothetical protein HNY73_019113 [Argiope bruennichi]